MVVKAKSAFNRDEYLRRVQAVKALMRQEGADLLLITSFESIIYLSGYTAESAYVPQGLVITEREVEPAFFVRALDYVAAQHQCFMSAARIACYSEEYVGVAGRDGFDFLIERILDHREASGSIAIEKSNLGIEVVDKFQRKLQPKGWIDFSGKIETLRWIKSDAEVQVMRDCAKVTDAAMMKAVEVARPGVRECEVAAATLQIMTCGVAGVAPDYVQAPLICTGPRTATAHIYWANQVLEKGTQINIELGAYVHRYATGLMRTLVLGPPSARLQAMHEAELAGLESALTVVRPGRTCGEVARAFYRELEIRGLNKASRCGYSIGINWMEHGLSLRRDCETPLQTNMVFHLMLGNWVDEEFGYVISETFRVAPGGVECLTQAPRELFVL